MNKPFKILTILGSPHDAKSNTRAMVEDFVDEMSDAGLLLEHEVISLGRKVVKPCIACWNCTKEKACPLEDDDLAEIKAAMIDCDMLILASPVYTNQITAQMKALFDRLFTWCHVFPLLGKYSLSACTTGNDGIKPTGDFIEKMLATYGTRSFGTINSKGGFTSGFFPGREIARKKNQKLAIQAAKMIIDNRLPSVRPMQWKMFKVMKRKLSGSYAINCMIDGIPESQPAPSKALMKLLTTILKRMKITDLQLIRISRLISFELRWWKDRGWLRARTLKQLAGTPTPAGFNVKNRLLQPDSGNPDIIEQVKTTVGYTM